MGRARRGKLYQSGSRSGVGGSIWGRSRVGEGNSVRARGIGCIPPKGCNRDRYILEGGCKIWDRGERWGLGIQFWWGRNRDERWSMGVQKLWYGGKWYGEDVE